MPSSDAAHSLHIQLAAKLRTGRLHTPAAAAAAMCVARAATPDCGMLRQSQVLTTVTHTAVSICRLIVGGVALRSLLRINFVLGSK